MTTIKYVIMTRTKGEATLTLIKATMFIPNTNQLDVVLILLTRT